MKLQRIRIWGIKDGSRFYLDQQGPTLVMEPEVVAVREAENILEAAKAHLDEVIEVWLGVWDSDKRMQEWADAWNGHRRSDDKPELLSVEATRSHYKRRLAVMAAATEELWFESAETYEARLAMSDEDLSKFLKIEYEQALAAYKKVYTIETQREVEYDDFVRHNQGPPWTWESLLNNLNPEDGLRRGRRHEKDALYEELVPTEAKKCRDCLQPCEWGWHSCFPGPRCGSAGWVAFCRNCKTWHQERTSVIS